jgi:hypothetical protein
MIRNIHFGSTFTRDQTDGPISAIVAQEKLIHAVYPITHAEWAYSTPLDDIPGPALPGFLFD